MNVSDKKKLAKDWAEQLIYNSKAPLRIPEGTISESVSQIRFLTAQLLFNAGYPPPVVNNVVYSATVEIA